MFHYLAVFIFLVVFFSNTIFLDKGRWVKREREQPSDSNYFSSTEFFFVHLSEIFIFSHTRPIFIPPGSRVMYDVLIFSIPFYFFFVC